MAMARAHSQHQHRALAARNGMRLIGIWRARISALQHGAWREQAYGSRSGETTAAAK